MDAEKRKQILEKLKKSGRQGCEAEVSAILAEEKPSISFLYEHIRKYVLLKYMLEPDTREDNIKKLASLSLAKTLKLDPQTLRELDRANPCDHATSEGTKKVLLLYAIQKDLQLKEDPVKLSKTQTISELAQYVYENKYAVQEQSDFCSI